MRRTALLVAAFALPLAVGACSKSQAEKSSVAKTAATRPADPPPPEPTPPAPAPAPTPATVATKRAKASESFNPWAGAIQPAPPSGEVFAQPLWSAWFPTDREPTYARTLQYVGGTTSAVDSHYYARKGTEFRVSTSAYTTKKYTTAEALAALAEYKAAMADVMGDKESGPPAEPEVVGGLPTVEFRSSGKRFDKPQSQWVRATLVGQTLVSARVTGADPKVVFGPDAKKFVGSVKFTAKAKAEHKAKSAG